jgi:hypothetical protein
VSFTTTLQKTARRTSTAAAEQLVVVPQVLSFPSYNARRSDPMFAFNVMSGSMLTSCLQNFLFFQNSKWFTLLLIAVLVNKTETDTVAVDATAVAVATVVADEAAVVAVDTAAVAEVTVVAAGAAVAAVTVVDEAAAVDEAAVAAVTVVDEAAAVDEAAVAEVTVVVEATTVAGDPDSVMATAAVAMIHVRTTVAREVPLRGTEARHEDKPTNLLRIRRKASVTVKPIETTGRRKVASAVAAKETTEPTLILPRHSWLVARRFHNLQ